MIRCRRPDGHTGEVIVRDSGSGFSSEARELVFEPFFTTKPGGTGMGLSIAQSIVDAHGGAIRAHNAEGGGAIVEFTLPLDPSAPSVMTAITIFIVDDDSSVRRALGRLLSAHGYVVRAFASADEFLAYAGDDRPACLVVDLRMPVKTGLDLFAALQVSHSDLPVIFITGHGDEPDAVQTMTKGAVDYLRKPFDDRALLDAIRRGLERRLADPT